MVYGELGRYPLRVLIHSRLIKFWAKIGTLSNMNKISFILYQMELLYIFFNLNPICDSYRNQPLLF